MMFDTDTPFAESYESFKALMSEKRDFKEDQDKLYYDFTEYAKVRAKFGEDPDAIEWVTLEKVIGTINQDKEQSDLEPCSYHKSIEESEDQNTDDQVEPSKEERTPFNLDQISFQEPYDGEDEDSESSYSHAPSHSAYADPDSDYYQDKSEILRKESKQGVFQDIDYIALSTVKTRIEAFIGLEDVKHKTEDIIAFARVQKLKRERQLKNSIPSFNISFTGEPGTGKTTMAREYGELFKALGLLKKGHVVEVSRSDLIGAYIGHTEKMTQEAFYNALDGVLFIDEAHNIYDPHCPYDFGRECLSTLIKLMEDFRERVVVIFAGYDDQLNNTLYRYEGMKSRIPHKIHFKSYTPKELVDIFVKICTEENYQISDTCREGLLHSLSSNKRKSNKQWNGREIRNLFENSLILQARRISKIENPTNDHLLTLELQDLELSVHKTEGNIVHLDDHKE